jgi:ABC-type nitrate/sulfonate/bicarbonate transport system substrate-binding protein
VKRGAPDARTTLIVFPGGFNWPVWVAQECGLFARHGIEVDVATTPGSVFQWTSLANGEAQIAITLMDNVIAYREGQGEAPVAVPDAVAVMGLDNRAMPALVTAPDIRRYADLDGKTLAVDAMKTGNALVLIGMLARGGLSRGDYRIERAGGVKQRFEAIQRGEYAGALFNSPFEGLLRELGFNLLDSAGSLLPHFQGHVVAVRKGWADANRHVVIGFLRAIIESLAWLYDARNREHAFAIHDRNMPGSPPNAAQLTYDVLFDTGTGFPRNGDIDLDGVREVVALRARYGEPKQALSDASAYCDRRFLEEALAGRRRRAVR